MSDKEYIKELEKSADELMKMRERFALMNDIIKAKVNIIDSNFFTLIHPKQLCCYMESLGWQQKYEKTHERYLTRCYLSPHKDAKCKVFIQDLYANSPTISKYSDNGLAGKTKEVISLLARIHKKGELEVIFEILSERNNTQPEISETSKS